MKRLVLKVPGETDYLEKIRQFVSDFAEACGFSEEEKGDIEISADEAATNIVQHAYLQDPSIPEQDRTIDVVLDAIPGGMEIRFRDRGKPFDPKTRPMPDMAEQIVRKRTHGMGIFAMKMFMDEIDHEYIEGSRGGEAPGNLVTLRKFRKTGPTGND
jgi:anti-sigma regulatory factor (Ser/Thr protein kinase)